MKINIKNYVTREQEELKKHLDLHYPPKLLILQLGDDAASNSYIKGKMNDAKECGIIATLFKTDSYREMLSFVSSNHSNYDGFILQEPNGLTKTERQGIYKCFTPSQDVDGFKKDSKHSPCTPKGIMDVIAEFYPKEDLHGETAVVIGRGELVGAPLVPMLIEKGCTVISCNSKTKNLKELTKMADIVITAVGKQNLVTREMLRDGAFVLDAGIAFDENGKLCGDCDKKLYDDPQIAISTVPGGIGLTTRLALMKNVYSSAGLIPKAR